MIEHNESNFEIVQVEHRGSLIAARINYPDCPHGDKIMVFDNVTEDQLREMIKINPHFEKEGISPVARFNPHAHGWARAMAYIELDQGVKYYVSSITIDRD